MNTFDLVVIGVVGLATLLGLWKGLIKQLFVLAGVIAGYLLAIQLYEPVSKYFTNIDQGLSKIISFLAIFIACIVIASIMGWVAGRIFKIAGLNWANRIGGGVLGFLKGFFVIAAVALMLLAFLPVHSSVIKDSVTLPYVNMGITVMRSVIPEGLWTKYEKKLEDTKSRWLNKRLKKA